MLLIKIVNQPVSKFEAKIDISKGRFFHTREEIMDYFWVIKVMPGTVRYWNEFEKNRIDMLKELREITGWGLKEAKDQMEFCITNKINIKYVDYF